MMLAGIGAWFANNKLARDIAIFIGVIIGLIIGERIYRSNVESGVKRRMNDKHAREQAEEHARTVETVNRVGQETENAKDRALSAPSTVSDVASADELRDRYPDNAAVILRPRGAGGSEGTR